ncbi:MAG: alpha/beta hydrolase [Lautropia sp.]|nr:alpha/beta hydrolase [Lautropia sp.]
MQRLQPVLKSVTCAHPGGLHRLAYAEWGEADNPRVVMCVHGLTRNGRDFDELARALVEDGYRVVCPDMPGRGGSDWLSDTSGYALPLYIADCVTLLARLDTEQVDWVGTSMGGLIGIMLAAMPGSRNPVARLVINDIGPVVNHEGVSRLVHQLSRRPDAFATFEEGLAYTRDVAAASFGPHTPEQWRLLAEHTVVPKDGHWVMHYDPAIITVAMQALDRLAPPLWDVWDRIRCPALVLRGAESTLLDEDVAQAMTQRGPKARLQTYEGVGHAPSLIQPGQIADVVAFLKESLPS